MIRGIARPAPEWMRDLAPALLILLASSVPAQAQQAYETPEAAAEAFAAALGDPEQMHEVLGANFEAFIPTDEIGHEQVQAFRTAWEQQHDVIADPDDPESGRMAIAVGEGDWTLPIPLAESEAGWQFDLMAGADEMKTRRIGRNEFAAIGATLAYYHAQREYAERDHDGDGFLEYAQRIVSTPGEMDGLYWARLDDEQESPLGPLFDDGEVGGGYHGYQFRILTAQGPAARGGAYGYVVDGNMRGGFALVAWPTRYDDTGVMTFMVNQDGSVFQTDLGADTGSIVQEIQVFNPDETWEAVDTSAAG